MDRTAALAHLGLTGNEDPGGVTKAYSERLATVQERLVSAQTEADRIQSQTKLSELVEAFELVTSSGRYTKFRNNDAGATVMRSAEEIAAGTVPTYGDTSIRMEPGAVLSGRIEIHEMLGSGGMGNVYAARDRLKDEDIAIKVLRQDLVFSAAAKERFLAEAKMSTSLSHPNIVRVHDVGVSGNHYYFSMERLRGHTLRQRIEAYHRDNRPFSLAEVNDIARQLIDALRYAHRYIVHRDLKPENIWLAEDGTVKLMDFGIARAYTSSQLTQTGMTLGTAYYMAPEQRLTAKEADWRADQYSLGIVIYELLVGSVPMGAVKPLQSLRRDIPARYAQALTKAIAPKPDDRWKSLDELLAEMQAPPSKAPKTAVAVVLIGSLLVAAGAGAVYFGGFKALLSSNGTATAAKESDGAKGLDSAAGSAGSAAGASGTADGTGPGSPTEPPAGSPPTNPPVDTSTVVAAAPVEEEKKSEPSPVDAMTGPVKESTDLVAAAVPSPAETKASSNAKSTEPGGAKSKASSGDTAPPTRIAMVDQSRSAESQTARCVTQCERDQGECRSIGRRSKQECMRAVGFNASGGRIAPITSNRAAAECAFYGRQRCEYARDSGACFSRMRNRFDSCVAITGNVAARKQDCDEKATESDAMCLQELRDCRDSCQ
jgi:serine/threonine protein kinase